MINFKNLRWKNFLSTGNAWTEIDFERSPSTLIIGENGSGKSTLLDALTYALFNKPFRNVSKPQLINSINNKHCLVEINFSIGSKNYLIRRGLQPRVFDIEINGVKVDKNANIRDFQKYLEENILKLNYKSFTQIVMLGSASFTPFMQLHLGARREIIEDILDISIFTSMNSVLKTKYAELETKLRVITGEIDVAKQKANIQEQYIQTLETDKQSKVDKILEEIDETTKQVKIYQENAAATTKEKESLGNAKEKQQQLDKYRTKFEQQISSHRKHLDFFHNTDECPTCQQGIEHDHKEIMTQRDEDKISELEKALVELDTQYSEVEKLVAQIQELDNKIMEANNEAISQQRLLQRLQLEYQDTQNKVGDIDVEKKKLRKLAKEAVGKTEEKITLTEDEHYFDVAKAMLQDSGIKTKIIKAYLPIINKLVNKYLASMDFFVQFELDETFKETIKSRHRDEFSYASFSEGEKQRIDLALLFTWREVAKFKNSVSTNLMVLDEVFDSSLDGQGTEEFLKIIKYVIEDANIFVISHKTGLDDRFENVVRFEKIKGFSRMAS